MVAYFTTRATKKRVTTSDAIFVIINNYCSSTNRKTTRKEVDKKLKNFVPRVGMCMAVLIIKFQHKIGTQRVHSSPQARRLPVCLKITEK